MKNKKIIDHLLNSGINFQPKKETLYFIQIQVKLVLTFKVYKCWKKKNPSKKEKRILLKQIYSIKSS